MRRRIAVLPAAVVLAALGAPVGAATFDMASYMALTPGHWAILQDNASGQQYGYVTSANAAGQVVQTWYRLQASGWQFDSADTFSVTNRRITYVSSHDGTHEWLLEPALSFPRRQQVGDTTTYKGALRNTTTGDAVPTATVITLTTEDIAASTPAGSFGNCIKTRVYSVGGGSSRDSVSINCAGRLEVLTWYHKIKDTASPTVQDLSDTHAGTMVMGGAANPPIP